MLLAGAPYGFGSGFWYGFRSNLLDQDLAWVERKDLISLSITWFISSALQISTDFWVAPLRPSTLEFDRATGPFLKSTGDIRLRDMRHEVKKDNDMRHEVKKDNDMRHCHFLNLTCDMGIIKHQRHATFQFLKIARWHGDPLQEPHHLPAAVTSLNHHSARQRYRPYRRSYPQQKAFLTAISEGRATRRGHLSLWEAYLQMVTTPSKRTTVKPPI